MSSDCPYRTDGLPSIRAGAAQTVITPPIGVSLAGYFHDRVAQSVRDDLFCRALVIESAGRCVAFVSCDLIAVGGDVVDRAKAVIQERAGLAPETVLVCATHTHTGPETRRGRVVPVCDDWLGSLPGHIADTVVAARGSMFDAFLVPGHREEHRIGSNRLGRRTDGTEVFGKQDVIGPAGPIDPELVGLAVRDMSGNVRAMLVNYAMHPDVIGGGSASFISADWPGELARTVGRVYGNDVVTVFMNGTCGDVNHYVWSSTRQAARGPAKAVQMGTAFAALAVNATETGEPMETAECRAELRLLDIPWYTRGAGLLAEADDLRHKTNGTDFERYIASATEGWPYDGQIARVPVQVLRLGELCVVGLPGEVFVRWGLEIKHWSPAAHTMIAELANDWFGYIPTTDQAHRGAYGAKPILSRRLCADAGRRVADAVQVMMHQLWS